MAMLSGFADDLAIGLADEEQMPKMRYFTDIYEEGSDGMNSWEKTCMSRIGSLKGSKHMPEGWKEGETILCDPPVQRYLGVYMGRDLEACVRAWCKRSTERVAARAARWKERGMPVTRGGRCTALGNSILPTAWYTVESQWHTDTVAELEKWRREGWAFMNSGRMGQKGSARVEYLTMIQDHDEGGVRMPDVELFVKSLYVRKVRHMVEPRQGMHKNALFSCCQPSTPHSGSKIPWYTFAGGRGAWFAW